MANLFERIREQMEGQSKEADLEADFNKTRARIAESRYPGYEPPSSQAIGSSYSNSSQENPRQLQGIADLLATRGRYGDSMMVHMNPVEVQGLASMSPTGSLTINPDTGQPEAFLPFLAPILAGMGGSALAGTAAATAIGLGGLSGAALGAIASGATTAIIEGDLKKGIVSGLTGFGIGKGLEAGMQALSGGTEALARQGADASAKAIADAAPSITGSQSINIPGLTSGPTNVSFNDPDLLAAIGDTAATEATSGGLFGNMPIPESAGGVNIQNPGGASFGERLAGTFSGEGLKSLTSVPTLAAVGIAEGTNEQIRVDEMMEGMAKDQLREKKQDYESSVARRDASYFPGYQKPYGDSYTQYASDGGIVSLDPSDFERRMTELQQLGRPVKKMFYGGGIDFSRLAMKAPAEASQGGLRDPHTISPEQLQNTYQEQGLPGFGPEIMYFTPEKGKDPNPFKGWSPDAPEIAPLEGGEGSTAAKPRFDYDPAIGELFKSGEISYPQYIALMTGETLDLTSGSQGSGGALATDADGGGISPEDYAQLYGAYMNYGKDDYNFNFAGGGGIQDLGGEGQSNQEADRLIELTSMAVLGNLPEEESEVVIEAFIDEFGDEAFQMLRDQVLETVVPGSQKEGEIVGSGGGMDDEIMGMIGNQQPVAVSPGEYIVPADVVSGLGDGSTDAGVQELDGMLDRVRVERTNTTQQPAPLRKGGVLPR